MPASVQATTVWEARFYFLNQAQTQLGINTMHYRCEAHTGGGVTDQELADHLSTILALAFRDMIHSGATYEGVQVRRVFPTPTTVPALSRLSRGLGTAGVSQLPGQNAILIRKFTDEVGPANRGRLYLPFPAAQQLDNLGKISDATVAIALALTDILDDAVFATAGGRTSNLRPIIFHREDATYAFIIEMAANRQLATQKRRSYYGRQNVLPF